MAKGPSNMSASTSTPAATTTAAATAPAKRKQTRPQGPKQLYIVLDDTLLGSFQNTSTGQPMTKADFVSLMAKSTTNGRVLLDELTSANPRQVVKMTITAGASRKKADGDVSSTDGDGEDSVSVE
jgi:hypothetical protein